MTDAKRIPMADIKDNRNDGDLNREQIQTLADSMAEIGLLNPLTLDREYMVIAGHHRFAAAKLLGWREIFCHVIDLDGLYSELAEIDENIVRRKIPAIVYGELLLRRKKIYETLHPETKNGGDRRSEKSVEKTRSAKCTSDPPKSFVQDTAEKLGVDPSTVRRQIQAAKNLTEEAKTILKGSDAKVSKKDAMKLSRLAPEQQNEAAAQLASGEIHTVSEYQPKQNRTFAEDVAYMKSNDKDFRCTPGFLLADVRALANSFHQHIAGYYTPYYEETFPAFSTQELDELLQHLNSIRGDAKQLYEAIERMTRT